MESKTETLTLSLIHSAQQGQPSSRSTLAEQIQPKVYAYCLRVTLDAHVAEDLCQETMVSLFTNFERLTFATPNHLWAWLYKTALNRIRNYSSHQRVMKTSIATMREKTQHGLQNSHQATDAQDQAIREELLHAVTQAIKTLKLQYRNVLALRCFQELSYAEIGQITGQSELSARMLFFRAKQSLTRQLTRDGFKPGSLLSGLSLFATATLAPSEAASAAVVNHTLLTTGLLVKILTWLSTARVALTLVGFGVFSALTCGTLVMLAPEKPTFHPVTEDQLAGIEWSYPKRLVNAYDPDRSGWQGAFLRDENTERSHGPEELSLEQWINHPTGPEAAWVHLPRDHWLEIDCGHTIIDGDGDDVFISERCCHGESAEIYLVSLAGRSQRLGLLQIPATYEHGNFTYGFDLAKLAHPFPAQIIRIKCISSGIPENRYVPLGMELLNVRARIK